MRVWPMAERGTGRLDNEVRDHDKSASENNHEVKVDSHVFLVRLWLEETPEAETLWKGRVQHILRGQSHAFTGPGMLISRIAALLADVDHPGPRTGRQEQIARSPEPPEEAGS